MLKEDEFIAHNPAPNIIPYASGVPAGARSVFSIICRGGNIYD